MKKLFLFLLLIINSFSITPLINRKTFSLDEFKNKIKSFVNDTLPCSKMKEKKECQNLCRKLLTEKYNVTNITIVDKISNKIADIYFRNTENLAKNIFNTKINKINQNNIRVDGGGVIRGGYETQGGRIGGDDDDNCDESDWWYNILLAACFWC
jgi:hypothetical protein